MQDHSRAHRQPIAAALAITLALFTCAVSGEEEKLPAGAKVARIEGTPPAITLKNPFDYAQVILTAQLSTGDKVDVTRMAKAEAPGIVKVSPTGLVRPQADGTGQLRFSLDGQSASVAVKVGAQKEKYPVSFVRDVM